MANSSIIFNAEPPAEDPSQHLGEELPASVCNWWLTDCQALMRNESGDLVWTQTSRYAYVPMPNETVMFKAKKVGGVARWTYPSTLEVSEAMAQFRVSAITAEIPREQWSSFAMETAYQLVNS